MKALLRIFVSFYSKRMGPIGGLGAKAKCVCCTHAERYDQSDIYKSLFDSCLEDGLEDARVLVGSQLRGSFCISLSKKSC